MPPRLAAPQAESDVRRFLSSTHYVTTLSPLSMTDNVLNKTLVIYSVINIKNIQLMSS